MYIYIYICTHIYYIYTYRATAQEWHNTQIWMCHVAQDSHAHLNKSCCAGLTHTYEGVMSHTHTNESCHVHTWMSHVTQESHLRSKARGVERLPTHTHEGVMLHISMSLVKHTYAKSRKNFHSHIWMCHVTRVCECVMSHKRATFAPKAGEIERCRTHAYGWVMTHVWMGRVIRTYQNNRTMCHMHMKESWHTYETVMTLAHMNEPCHAGVAPVPRRQEESNDFLHTHMNELCHTCEWVMSHTRMKGDERSLSHTHELVTTRIRMSHVTRTYDWVMSHSNNNCASKRKGIQISRTPSWRCCIWRCWSWYSAAGSNYTVSVTPRFQNFLNKSGCKCD